MACRDSRDSSIQLSYNGTSGATLISVVLLFSSGISLLYGRNPTSSCSLNLSLRQTTRSLRTEPASFCNLSFLVLDIFLAGLGDLRFRVDSKFIFSFIADRSIGSGYLFVHVRVGFPPHRSPGRLPCRIERSWSTVRTFICRMREHAGTLFVHSGPDSSTVVSAVTADCQVMLLPLLSAGTSRGRAVRWLPAAYG